MPTISSDESQMKQLMLNLVGKAIKFHGLERPEITITASRGSNEWTFRVKDNGIGLNMEYAERYSRCSSGCILGTISRYGCRIGDSEEDRRKTWWADMGRVRGRKRDHVLLHHPGSRGGR